MKKIIAITTLILGIFSSISFANQNEHKKQHQISLELSNFDVDQTYGATTFLGADSDLIPTIRYSYTHQLEQVFLRPSVSYNLGDVSIVDNHPYVGTSVVFTPTYSVEGDIGLNLNSDTSIFATIGVIGAKWKHTTTTEGKDDGVVFGLGADYNINDNIIVSAKYQRATVDFGVEGSANDIETESDVIKVGIGYKF